MPLFTAAESVNPASANGVKAIEKVEAKIQKKDAKEAEKNAAKYLTMMIRDLRDKLRSKRERKVLSEEEHRLRLQHKWARMIWQKAVWR
jgi:hypothetical protein